MKKSLLGLLLAIALVVPAFAQKGDMSVNGKLGLGVSNNLALMNVDMAPSVSNLNMDYQMKIPVSLSAEFFYEAIDSLSLGIGGTYTFASKLKSDDNENGMKASTTNIYLAVKPEAKIDSEIFTSIYAIGQIGISSIKIEATNLDTGVNEEKTADIGIYLGLGVGTIIANQVIVELLCSSSNGSFSDEGKTIDFQYTAVTLNVGYKFSL